MENGRMPDDADALSPILELIGSAEAGDRPLSVVQVARGLGMSDSRAETLMERVEDVGLALTELKEPGSPILLRAGRQYLQRGGRVDRRVLEYLPHTINDLHAREALLRAGTTLVDQFRAATLAGSGVEHAQTIVPEGFERAITPRIALDLYGAAIALTVRLSNEAPAGCVAEEILAVELIEEARDRLDAELEARRIDKEDAAAAVAALPSLFELFEDDDVLALFVMEEPADAALAAHTPHHRLLGVVDQRVEAWFEPFEWAAPTGYLQPRPSD
jgi:hypothetical protein